MRIHAREFFEQYLILFERRRAADAAGLLKRFRDSKSWTDFMLNPPFAFLPEVVETVGQGRLEYRSEFKLADLCVWGKVDDLYHKPKNAQPLHVHILIEHENERNSEEEFWKLLHSYSPLKVLVCYPRCPGEKVEEFDTVRAKVRAFHPRSIDEEYLVIVGPQRATVSDPSMIVWKGWSCTSHQAKFEPLL